MEPNQINNWARVKSIHQVEDMYNYFVKDKDLHKYILCAVGM